MRFAKELFSFALLTGVAWALPAGTNTATTAAAVVPDSALEELLIVAAPALSNSDIPDGINASLADAFNGTLVPRRICLNCENDNGGGGGGGGGGGTKAPAHDANAAWLYWKQDWSVGGGVPVGGTHQIWMWSDGYVRFQTHFHDSGIPGANYNVALACGYRDQQGHVYQLARTSHVEGGWTSGDPDRNSDVDQMKYEFDVKNNWNAIWAAQQNGMRCSLSVRWDAMSVFNQLVSFFKTVGPIVGSIIALF